MRALVEKHAGETGGADQYQCDEDGRQEAGPAGRRERRLQIAKRLSEVLPGDAPAFGCEGGQECPIEKHVQSAGNPRAVRAGTLQDGRFEELVGLAASDLEAVRGVGQALLDR